MAVIKREMVGARGFEPPTSCSRSRRATRLRYAPRPLVFRRLWAANGPKLKLSGSWKTSRNWTHGLKKPAMDSYSLNRVVSRDF